MSDSTPRPHAWRSVAPMAGRALSGRGVHEVIVLRALTTSAVEHACDIRLWVPRLVSGESPPDPSLTLLHPPEYEMLRTWERDERRSFEHDGTTMRVQLAFPPGTSFYGLGEVPGPALRNGRVVRIWNTDAWAYGDETPALYQAHPYVLAVHADGSASGLLADTFRRGRVEVADDGVEFQFEGGPFDLFRIDGAGPADVQKGLAALIGTIELPPRWALGYHQCRWSYESESEVRALALRFRKEEIPCDAIWFDIDYMDRFRVFTWNEERFVDPSALVAELHGAGFRAVAILDPGVAEGSDLCDELVAGGHCVRTAGGEPARGRVWPGLCVFPDFTRPATRALWAERVRRFLDETPLDGLWTDMNEPALFRTPGGTLPDDARHAGWPASGPGDHARFHNLYGRLMAEATRAGMLEHASDRRPFVLTRSNHISGSAFAATWTGDNQSRWEDLAWAIPMATSLGVSGQPFAGPDVGGFYGDPSAELFERWFDLGAWLPFFRGHGEKHSARKEPWVFGPLTSARVRGAIERRLRLLPSLYTLFREAEESGLPIVRPLVFADPADPTLRARDDAFLLGDALLVAPVLEAGRVERSVALPGSDGWFELESGRFHAGGESPVIAAPPGTTPVFARAGAIVFEHATTGPNVEASAGLVVRVFLDGAGRAHGRLYEDAGEGRERALATYRDSLWSAVRTGALLTLREEAVGEYVPSRLVRDEVHALIVHASGGATWRFEDLGGSGGERTFELGP